jgi:hypothetical protein
MDPHILADLNIGVLADLFWLGKIKTKCPFLLT